MPPKAPIRSKVPAARGPRAKGRAATIDLEADDGATSGVTAAAASTTADNDDASTKTTDLLVPKTEPGTTTSTANLHDIEMISSDSSPAIDNDNNDNDAFGEDINLKEDEDQDDPVIKEYDVVINNSLEDMLHLFQYPNRLKHRPYSAHSGTMPLGGKWKLNSGLVELDVPLVVTNNYDRDKGMQWGQAMRVAKMKAMGAGGAGSSVAGGASGEFGNDNGKRRKVGGDDQGLAGGSGSGGGGGGGAPVMREELDFNTARARGLVLEKQTLGAKIQPNKTNYFVGVWDKDALHLTKLKDVVQLRPQFQHIDKVVEQERAAQKSLKEATAPTPKSQEARAVNLTVKGPVDGRFGDNRSAGNNDSIWNDLRNEEDEPWSTLDWVDQDTQHAWNLFDGLTKEETTPLTSTMSKLEYLDSCSAQTSFDFNEVKEEVKPKIK